MVFILTRNKLHRLTVNYSINSQFSLLGCTNPLSTLFQTSSFRFAGELPYVMRYIENKGALKREFLFNQFAAIIEIVTSPPF